jgi:hypothetical protein
MADIDELLIPALRATYSSGPGDEKSSINFSKLLKLGLIESPVLWHKSVTIREPISPLCVANLAKRLGECQWMLFAQLDSSFPTERRSSATLECGGATPLWLQSQTPHVTCESSCSLTKDDGRLWGGSKGDRVRQLKPEDCSEWKFRTR